MEQWKNVKGYEGIYLISNKGNVKRIVVKRCTHGKKTISVCDVNLKPFNNGHGYSVVTLMNDGKRKNYYVHRLVGEAFLPNPNALPEINHKDYNTGNNTVENLEWCSRQYNINFSACNKARQHKRTGKSGIRYIGVDKKGRYRVCILGAGVDRRFADLNDAIRYRDEVLNEIGYTI